MKLNDIYKKITALDEAMNEAASASINMSGDNAEDVIKLMNALKGTEGAKAGEPIPTAIKPAMNPMMGPMDPKDDMMSMMDLVSDKPKGMDMDKPMDDMACDDTDNEATADGYDNSPDEKYQDHNFMTKDIASGHDGAEKKSHGPVSGGDNPMALEDELRAELSAKLSEFMKEGNDCGCDEHDDHGQCESDCHCDEDVSEAKAKPDFLDMDKDGDKKEPMKKAIKDKDAKKESVQEGEGKKVQLPSGKEMKKCKDDGMSKADIMKKYTEMGCEAKQLEKLYASSCM
tara:strand:- start:134 stop:991 length:858 start_codon:yes stop_codon:yes gene_type:complete